MARRKNVVASADGRQWDLPTGSHVWVYLRHSPGDSQTIDSQVQAMQEWCALNCWLIDHMFIDEAAKGGNDDREQFQEMIALAHQKPKTVAGILLWDFGRFARNLLDAQFHKAELRRLGYVVLTKIDDVPNSDIAPLVEAFIDWKNERFLKDLSLNVKRGQAFIVSQNFWPSGQVPVGYRVEQVEMGRRPSGGTRYGKRLVKDEALQERMALVWKMKLEQNASLADIHAATHLRKWPNNYGDILDDLIYAGIFVFQGKRYPLDWESGARFCEPYVTLEQFTRVQELRAERRIGVIAPRALASTYLLSSMLQCGLCAEKGKKVGLIAGKDQTGYRYYKCGHKAAYTGGPCDLPGMSARRIDAALLQLMKQTVLTPDFVRAEVEQANVVLSQESHETVKHLRDAKRRVQSCKRDVENVVDLVRRKGMTDILETHYDAVNKAWNEAQAQVAILEERLTLGASLPKLSLSEAYTMLDGLLTALDSGVMHEQRDVIKSFVERIVVFPGRLEVTLKFSLPAVTPFPDQDGTGAFYPVNDMLAHDARTARPRCLCHTMWSSTLPRIYPFIASRHALSQFTLALHVILGQITGGDRVMAEQPQWQPISMLPTLTYVIDGMLESAEEQLANLRQARLGVLDDATVNRVIASFTTQRDDLWLYDEQFKRWHAEKLTVAQRREVERLQGQMKRLRVALDANLALADELKDFTIEKILGKSDEEVGLDFLLRLFEQ